MSDIMSSIYYIKNEIIIIIRDGEMNSAWIGVKGKCDKLLFGALSPSFLSLRDQSA